MVCFLSSIFVSLSICVLALAEQAGVALKGRAVYFAFFDLLYTIFERWRLTDWLTTEKKRGKRKDFTYFYHLLPLIAFLKNIFDINVLIFLFLFLLLIY